MKKIVKDYRRLWGGLTYVGLFSYILISMLTSIVAWNEYINFVWILSLTFIGIGLALISASRNTDANDKTFTKNFLIIYPITAFTSTTILFYIAGTVETGQFFYSFVTGVNALIIGYFVDYLKPWGK